MIRGGFNFTPSSKVKDTEFRSPSSHGRLLPSSSLVGVIFPSGKGRLRVDSNTRSTFSILGWRFACQQYLGHADVQLERRSHPVFIAHFEALREKPN